MIFQFIKRSAWQKWKAPPGSAFIVLAGAAVTVLADQDVSKMAARPSPDWLRSGTICMKSSRAIFSVASNFQGEK